MPLNRLQYYYNNLGSNLAKVRKCLEENYNLKIAIQLLVNFFQTNLCID